MLKKLVKYGNSNALVLDKALLELLNISEGSVVKIKTDGISLIITPQNAQEKEEISKTIVPYDLMIKANTETMVQSSKDPKQMQIYMDELRKIEAKYTNHLQEQYAKTDYFNKFSILSEKYKNNIASDNIMNPEFLKESKALLLECAPIYAQIEQEYRDVTEKYAPIESKTITQSTDHWFNYSEFKKIHEKYAHLSEPIKKLQENPEYINELVLLSEKYLIDKKSPEYIEESQKLMSKYIPEWGTYQEEIKNAVRAK